MQTELQALVAEGDRLFAAEEEVLKLAALLKRAQIKRDAIQNHDIPALMEEIGIESIKTAAGAIIEVKKIIAVQPKAADKPLVLKAVEAQGDGSVIKNTVSVSFGREQNDAATLFVEKLEADGLTVRQDRKIEPQTLAKLIRDRLEKGLAVDEKLFGVDRFNKAVFKDGAPKAPIFEDE
jgi:hypothetical protein